MRKIFLLLAVTLAASSLLSQEIKESPPQEMKVSSPDGSLNVRAEPNAKSEIVAIVKNGIIVTRSYEQGDWAYIRFYSSEIHNLVTGYVKSKFLVGAEASIKPAEKGAKPIVNSEKLVGNWYADDVPLGFILKENGEASIVVGDAQRSQWTWKVEGDVVTLLERSSDDSAGSSILLRIRVSNSQVTLISSKGRTYKLSN